MSNFFSYITTANIAAVTAGGINTGIHATIATATTT